MRSHKRESEPESTPTQVEIRAAAGKTVPDVIIPGLAVVFVGINPGLYSAAVGHHFARPGNRFWPALYRAGITPRMLFPYEERELLNLGCGITNVVSRATAGADELSATELAEGGRALVEKIAHWQPKRLAFLGIGAFRSAYHLPGAVLGRQLERISGAEVWVLPNPSGLNAHYSLDELALRLRAMRESPAG
jgi:double-stranded uracil-DNA glycosylase